MSNAPRIREPATLSAVAGPGFDYSRHVICQCRVRFIAPDDIYKKKGPNKGNQHTKCRVCRGRTPKDKFPADLVVPDHLRPGRKPDASLDSAPDDALDDVPNDALDDVPDDAPIEQSEESKWLATLSLEQESVLRHNQDVVKRLPPSATLHDLPHANSAIQWQEIESRLEDVYSLDRLFQNYDSIQSHYKVDVNTVAPIGLITVSLNNAAIRQGLPFRFCWIDIPFQGASAAFFMSLNAPSLSERAQWQNSTLAQRLQSCSAWQSSIRKTAEVVIVKFDTTSECSIGGNGEVRIPAAFRRSLLWAQTVRHGTERPSMLCFANGSSSVIKNQCHDDSDKLLQILVDCYHQHMSKQVWDVVQETALATLNSSRAPSDKVRLECAQMIRDRQQGSKSEEPEDSE